MGDCGAPGSAVCWKVRGCVGVCDGVAAAAAVAVKGGAVVCEYFDFFQSSSVGGPCVVVCGDFENFKELLCVSSVLWCGDFENFQRSPVCVGSVLCGVRRL